MRCMYATKCMRQKIMGKWGSQNFTKGGSHRVYKVFLGAGLTIMACIDERNLVSKATLYFCYRLLILAVESSHTPVHFRKLCLQGSHSTI